MNDELQGALAQLASDLGVEVGTLWAWLQDGGLQAYASVEITSGIISSIGWFITTVLCLVVVVTVFRHIKKNEDRYYDNLDYCLGYCLAEIFPAGSLAFCFYSFIVDISQVICWIVSPQGMIIRKLLELANIN